MEKQNSMPLENGASQVLRQNCVVTYLFVENSIARPLAIFQFPEGETPTFPVRGDYFMAPLASFIVEEVVYAHKFGDGLYTELVTLILKKATLPKELARDYEIRKGSNTSDR